MQALFQWMSDQFLGSSKIAAERLLAADLYQNTQEIHMRVEKHPFVQHLLKDTLESASYQQYLVDLKLVYVVLEEEIKLNLHTQ